MGFDIHTIEYLLAAKAGDVSFEHVAMIGRQSLGTSARELERAFRFFGHSLSANEVDEILTGTNGYADKLFEKMGAGRVDSLDASEYENATLIHDLNEPIPDEIKERFSLVIDGGSLEHVFNVPVALRNCMEMVAVGGHYISIHPANNFFGHGFYQFSPDLYFRAFTEENGFAIDRVVALEIRPGAPWYSVVDPEKAGRRVRLTNRRPVHLIVQARRIAKAPVFATTPQQSKYSDLWEDGEKPGAKPGEPPAEKKPNALYRWLRRTTKEAIKATVKPRFNPKVFRKIRRAGLPQGRFED
jgi:hypothetical protein